jgi:hypothetical protein
MLLYLGVTLFLGKTWTEGVREEGDEEDI